MDKFFPPIQPWTWKKKWAHTQIYTHSQTHHTYLLLLFLVIDKMFPLRNVLGSLQYQLHRLVEGGLKIIQARFQDHIRNGKHNVSPEKWGLGVHLVSILAVLVEDLESPLDGVQRQTSAWWSYGKKSRYSTHSFTFFFYNPRWNWS